MRPGAAAGDGPLVDLTEDSWRRCLEMNLTGSWLLTQAAAKAMIGRPPPTLRTVRPMRSGVVTDFDVTERLIRYLIQQVQNSRFAKPRLVVAVHQVEIRK